MNVRLFTHAGKFVTIDKLIIQERGQEVSESPRLTRGLTWVLAIAAGLSVANIYYNQPLLGSVSRHYRGASLIHLIPASTQLGYAAGLLFLVPLGDAASRRRVILWQTLGLVAALAFVSWAHTPATLLVGSVVVGATATVAQQIIPLAAELADPLQRGQAVGTVMSGLLTGILLARTLSGVVGQYLGWSGVFWISTAMAVLLGIMLYATLPRHVHFRHTAYGDLLRSLVKILGDYPELRWAIIRQGGLFAAFSAFWSLLAVYLAQRYHVGSVAAGLYGILGFGGVLVAPFAGRRADLRGAGGLIAGGILLLLAGFIVFLIWPNYWGLGVGTLIMDAGVQMSMVSNQSIIFALNQDARSRINTLYMTGMFLCGAAGSALGSVAWNAAGWSGVMGLGLILGGISLASFRLGHHLRIREASA